MLLLLGMMKLQACFRLFISCVVRSHAHAQTNLIVTQANVFSANDHGFDTLFHIIYLLLSIGICIKATALD